MQDNWLDEHTFNCSVLGLSQGRQNGESSWRYNKMGSQSPERKSGGSTLYISNMSRLTSEQTLFSHFGRYGFISSSKIIKDPTTRESRGIGFVTFESDDDADLAAMTLNHTELDGNDIVVERSLKKLHNSNKGSSNTILSSHSTTSFLKPLIRPLPRSYSRSPTRTRRTPRTSPIRSRHREIVFHTKRSNSPDRARTRT